jgi:hypothetical protein
MGAGGMNEISADEVADVFANMSGRRPPGAPDKPPKDTRQPVDRITDLETAVSDLGKRVPVGRLQRLEDGLAAIKARVDALEKPISDPNPKGPPIDPPASRT